MKLAFSNIAWDESHDAQVAELLIAHGFTGVEVAPTKTWPDLSKVSELEVEQYRKHWEDLGLPIVAMQSLLFGRPDLTLFGDTKSRSALRDYLGQIFDIAAGLGAQPLVFGSPKNRQKGSMPDEEAFDLACGFFSDVGEDAASRGVILCLEANAPQYGCDFITTSTQAAELVQAVDSKGFGLHLDYACMEMAGENPIAQLNELLPMAKHFHLSSPMLGPVEPSQSLWHEIKRTLDTSGIFCSIEMRSQASPEESLLTVRKAIEATSV